MKKFFFSTILFLGMLVTVQAQVQLDYHIQNLSTTDTWSFGIAEANGQSTSFTLAPGASMTQTLTNNFAFPITWKADNGNGCGDTVEEFNLVFPEITHNFSCSTGSATAIYKIEQLSPTQVIFKMGLF